MDLSFLITSDSRQLLRRLQLVVLLCICLYENINAQAWESVPIGSDYQINDIQYDSIHDRILLLAGDEFEGYYLYISVDNGEHWSSHPMPTDAGKIIASYTDIAFTETGGIYIPTNTGVYYTDSDGTSWKKIEKLTTSNAQNTIEYSKYLGLLVGGDGLYRYDITLNEYILLDSALSINNVWDILALDSVIAISYSDDVLVSRNLGKDWLSVVSKPVDYLSVYPLAYDPQYSVLYYKTTSDTVYVYDTVNRQHSDIVLEETTSTNLSPSSLAIAAGHTIICCVDLFYQTLFIWDYYYPSRKIESINVSSLDPTNVWHVKCMINGDGVLYVCTNNGLYRTTEPVVTSVERSDNPLHYQVSSYPTPVAPGTPLTVSYSLERAATLSLQIKDILGRTVREEPVGQRAPGQHTYSISTVGLEPGMYFFSLLPGNGAPMSGKMVVR